MPIIQGLGWLDIQLIAGDSVHDESLTNEDKLEHATVLTHRFTLSYLWVLGAYEVVRTLAQWDKETAALGQLSREKLSTLKGQIERLRVPLAKLEPARRFAGIDAPVAYPAMHPTLGISWLLNSSEGISRRELSDRLLEFLSTLGGPYPPSPKEPRT